MKIVKLSSFSEKVATKDRETELENRKQKLPVKKVRLTRDIGHNNGFLCDGDKYLDMIFKTAAKLDNAGFKREPHQIEIHRACIIAALPQIYGSDFLVHKQRIMALFGIFLIRPQVVIVMPRRNGKTYAIAHLVTEYLWSVPGSEALVYSPCRRASQSFLEITENMTNEVIPNKSYIKSSNMEKLSITSSDGKTISTCYSYPSKVEVPILYFFLPNYMYILLFVFFLFLSQCWHFCLSISSLLSFLRVCFSCNQSGKISILYLLLLSFLMVNTSGLHSTFFSTPIARFFLIRISIIERNDLNF